MDLDKLTTSDKVIAGSGIVLFIASFLPWFKVSVSGFGSSTGNGWDVGFLWGGLPALLGLLSAAIVLATKLGTFKMPEMPFTSGQAMLGAGVISAVLVILKLIIGEDAPYGLNVDRSFGLFLAALAALGLAAGGYLAFQEEKGTSAA